MTASCAPAARCRPHNQPRTGCNGIDPRATSRSSMSANRPWREANSLSANEAMNSARQLARPFALDGLSAPALLFGKRRPTGRYLCYRRCELFHRVDTPISNYGYKWHPMFQQLACDDQGLFSRGFGDLDDAFRLSRFVLDDKHRLAVVPSKTAIRLLMKWRKRPTWRAIC
jgi:hypothetical protein